MSEKKELSRLIRRVQAGDLEAYGEIYDRFFDSVYAYVFRQVGSHADAEDITAGVFLDVFERIDGFKWRGAGFSAWIFQIARNDVLDHFRRQRGPRNAVSMSQDIEEMPDNELVEDIAEKTWDHEQLRSAIELLPDEQRQVILLRLMFNFSHRQIGEILEKSEGAVKALQHRAFGALRVTLGKMYAEELNAVNAG